MLGRWQPGDGGEFVQNLLQRKILTAQNVALAAFSLLQCRHMASSAFGYVHQIQARVHIGRKFLLQKIDHNSSRRRGLDVALAYRSRRIYHDHIHSRFAGLDRDFFRHKFRTLVGPDHIGQGNRRILVGQMPVRIGIPWSRRSRCKPRGALCSRGPLPESPLCLRHWSDTSAPDRGPTAGSLRRREIPHRIPPRLSSETLRRADPQPPARPAAPEYSSDRCWSEPEAEDRRPARPARERRDCPQIPVAPVTKAAFRQFSTWHIQRLHVANGLTECQMLIADC